MASNKEAYMSRKEAEATFVAKEECTRNRIEVLEKITDVEKHDIEQDGHIDALNKAVDKFSNVINKLTWSAIGVIVTTIWEIIQNYFSMKG